MMGADRIWSIAIWTYIIGALAGSVFYRSRTGMILYLAVCLAAACAILWHYKGKARTVQAALAGMVLIVAVKLIAPSFRPVYILYMTQLVGIVWIQKLEPRSLAKTLSVRAIPIRNFLLAVTVSITTLIALSYVGEMSTIFFRNYVNDTMDYAAMTPVTAIVIIGVMPALFEEIFFRGYLMQRIPGKKRALILSSLLFALLHMNVNQITYALLAGLLFAVIAARTGSILTTMVIHGLFNSWNLLLTCFADHPSVLALFKVRLGDYYLLGENPSFAAGNPPAVLILEGLAVFILFTALTILCVRAMKKGDSILREEGTWKPFPGYYICIGICILSTVLRDFVF